jgi:hypothetical protein
LGRRVSGRGSQAERKYITCQVNSSGTDRRDHG